MKKIILFLAITILISCKKEAEKSIIDKAQNIEVKRNDFISYGDSLVSQSSFVSQIQKSIDVKFQRNSLSKITFDYDKFKNWDLKTVEEKTIGTIIFKFEKENKQNSDADIYTHIKLCVYNKNKNIDNLTVYKQENYSEALASINQYFYIDSSLNLWTLGINEDEDGIKVIFWNQYKIDKESGKISVIKNNTFNNSPTVSINQSNSWEGKYFFEKSNRDHLKTSFEISINNLNDVKVVYIGDGEKPETYKNLIGEIVADNKLKVVFNKKYEDMGVIYIQKSGDQYIISGEPITNINPGNNEFPVKKVK